MGQVESKVAIVTGGASGIGAAGAATLAREAVRVRWAQRADRPERSRQSRGAARQGRAGAGYREWRAVPRLRASNYMTGAELVIDGGMTGGTRPRWS
jgi:NAD(P)-dependent dehydrogenase (short-subunit alcohol dehydrogenase family)